MDAYLWPLVSYRFYTTIIRQRKKDFEENEENKKKKKYSQKNAYVRTAYNPVCVCVCVDYIWVLLYVVVYLIVSLYVCMIYTQRGKFEVVSWIYV